MIDFSIADLLGGEPVEIEGWVNAKEAVILHPESDQDFRPRVLEAATGLLKEEALTASTYRLDAIGDRYGVYRKGVEAPAKD